MRISEDFAIILNDIVGNDSQGKAEIKTGISKSYWVYLLKGKVPRPEALEKIIDGYKPSQAVIKALYTTAGYEIPHKYTQPDELPKGAFPHPDNLSPVPVLGIIRAGKPILAEQNIESYIFLDERYTSHKDCFCLRVTGDSMIGAGILPGSVVIVFPQNDVPSKKVGVVMINGEDATVKTIIKKKDGIMLKPENPNYESIFLPTGSAYKIIGRVVGIFTDMM